MPCWWFLNLVLFPPVACLPLGSGAAGAWWKGCDEKSGIISFLVRCHTDLSGWFMIQREKPGPAYGSQLCGRDRVPAHHCGVCEGLIPHYPSVQTNVSVCWLSESNCLQFAETNRQSTDISCHVLNIMQWGFMQWANGCDFNKTWDIPC